MESLKNRRGRRWIARHRSAASGGRTSVREHNSPRPRLALRAIGCTDVRSGILPSQCEHRWRASQRLNQGLPI